MLKKPLWKKTVAMILCALVVFTALNFRIGTAVADEKDDSETVDYVLILDCTKKAILSDTTGIRKAAAKMFVDLMPVGNARVSVFKIGDPDLNAEKRRSEGAKSYALSADNDHMADALYRMRCIYQLWDFSQPIETHEQRETLKTVIDNAYLKGESDYSDVHCAVYAAVDMLKSWNSTNACILLVSEEFTAHYTSHKVKDGNGKEVESDHSMWDDIERDLIEHRNWVLNWVDLGSKSADNRKIIENICNMHGGEACYGFSISKLPEKIANIVSKYAGQSDDEGTVQALDNSGNATIQLPAFKIMLTEANIVVTGDGVEKVTVTDERGSRIDKPKDDIWFSTNVDPQDRTHFLYSAVKMIRPSSGAWTVNVKGKAGTQVYVQTIQTLEPDIHLDCNVKPGQSIGVGTTLKFTATFEYNHEKLRCGDEAYKHYLPGAKLYYTHSSDPHNEQPINSLRVENEQYVAEFTVQERGTYTFYFHVDSNDFKSRIRHANPIENITVENHAPSAVGRLSDINDVPVGTTLEGAVNVGALFVDQDNEPLQYDIECKKDERPFELEHELGNDNFLTIKAPQKDGAYVIEISARDSNGARSEVLSFVLRTVNQPPQMLQTAPLKVKQIAKAPKGLVSMGLLPKNESKPFTINMKELFADPEGLPLSFSVDDSEAVDKENKEIVGVAFNEKTGEMTVTAKNKGEAKVYVMAEDSAGASERFQINFTVRNAGSALFARYWWFFALLALIIAVTIILLISRRVKGSWTVDVEDSENGGSCAHDFKSLPAAGDKMLRGTKVTLLAMAKRAVIAEGVQDNVKLNRLPAGVVVFHGSLSQGKTVTFTYTPSARVAVSIGETKLTARKQKQFKLNRRDELVVTCKNQLDEEVLFVKVSFQ